MFPAEFGANADEEGGVPTPGDAFDSLPVTVFEADTRGILVYLNAAAFDLFGFDPEDLRAGRLRATQMVVEADAIRVRDNVERLATGVVIGPQYYTVRITGRDLPVVVFSRPVRRDGAVVGIRGVVVDMSPLSEVQGALRRSEHRLRRVLEAVPDLVLEIDATGVFVDAFVRNPELLYTSPDRFIGRPVDEVLPAAASRPCRAAVATALASGHAQATSYDLQIGHEIHNFEAWVVPEGQTAFVIVRDVTEQTRARAALARAERVASLGTLAAGVAHELNNPLTYVIANLDVLEPLLAQLPEPARSTAATTFAQMRLGADRARAIVGDLHLFARGGQPGRSTAAVAVEPTVRAALALADAEIRPRARVITDLAEVPPVRAEPGRLEQVLVNLLVNAAQALPPGLPDVHEVRVSARFVDGRVVIEIRDTGPGIPPDVLPRMFEPFFTTKPTVGGTGLGLAICDALVRAMGGSLTARNEGGAVLRIELQPTTAAPAGPPPDDGAPDQPLRVLVIDDEPLIGQLAAAALDGHAITLAASGREALSLLHDGVFDVIVCDLMMPDIGGPELWEHLTRERAELRDRILWMTGGASTEASRDLLATATNPVLTKPFRLDELLAAVVAHGRRVRGAPSARPG